MSQRLQNYLLIGIFIFVNVVTFQNFESSFDIQKSKTDFSGAIQQAEKDSDRTLNKMEFSSEAQAPTTKNSAASTTSSAVQIPVDQPVKIRLKRAPTAKTRAKKIKNKSTRTQKKSVQKVNRKLNTSSKMKKKSTLRSSQNKKKQTQQLKVLPSQNEKARRSTSSENKK